MKPFTFAVDVDGVIRNWDEGLRQVWCELGGAVSPVCDTWDLCDHYHHASLKVNDVAFRTHPQEVQRRAPEFPGAIDALSLLEKLGIDIVIVTAQPNFMCRLATTEWLVQHSVPFTGLRYVAGRGDKTVVDADLYIDDGPHNIERFAETGKHAIIMDRPYNRALPDYGYPRTNDWNAIVDLVLARRAALELVA